MQKNGISILNKQPFVPLLRHGLVLINAAVTRLGRWEIYQWPSLYYNQEKSSIVCNNVFGLIKGDLKRYGGYLNVVHHSDNSQSISQWKDRSDWRSVCICSTSRFRQVFQSKLC